MFWSVVLPFFVTCFLLAAAVILATIAAPRFRWPRRWMFAWTALLAMVAFVPTYFVVYKATLAMRLGVGKYENYDSIWDRRFKRWLPEEATEIVSRRHIQGYDARFKIDRKSLDAWFDRCWANAREKAVPREEPTVDVVFDPAEMERRFGELGKHAPRDGVWIKYEGPQRSNWAGATTWFDEDSGVAYQDVGFW